MPDLNLTIGTMSAQTRCSVPTIRYYEKIGLLPSPERAANGHRYYREVDLKRLTFIKRCRDFGFPIEQVRELTDLFEDGDRACVEVRELAQAHLDEVRVKLAEMHELEASLTAFVCSCDTACSGGLTKDCVIIDDLSMPVPEIATTGVSCCAVPAKAGATFTTTELKRK
jgi:DNA-binding transcriptional MerR regulator